MRHAKNKGGFIKSLPSIVWIILIVLSISSIAGAAPPIELMKKSTVRIVCGNGSGSGFVIDNGHMVVTNWHVVDGAADGLVPAIFLGGVTYEINAQVIWYSERMDLAILKVSQKLDRPSVVFASGNLVKEAENVYALGFPADADLIVDHNSFSTVKISNGVISACITSERGVDMFQTDAAINPGNSGGPLFNQYGQVVGINTSKITKEAVEGIGWAVQANQLMAELDRLGIPYKKASAFTNFPLYRFCKESPMLSFTIFAILLIITVGLFVLTWRNPLVKVQMSTKVQKPVLIGITGEFASNVIELGDGPITIGRDPKSSQIVFPKTVEKISRRHCMVWYDADVRLFFIEDCSSENGTFLENGKRVSASKRVPLESGVRFYLSDKRQLFEVSLKDIANPS